WYTRGLRWLTGTTLSMIGRRATSARRSLNSRSSGKFGLASVAWVSWMLPSSRSRRTSARQKMSSSHIVSVTIGVPSKSACVEIDGARGHDASAGVDHSIGRSLGTAADLRDATVLDPEVTLVARYPSPVDDGAVLDVNVIALHFSKPPSNPVLARSVTLGGR